MLDPDAQPSRHLEVRTVHYGPSTVVLLVGELDVACAPRFEAVFDSVCTERPECVVLDLTYVTFVDSSGLGALHRAWLRAAQSALELAIVPSSAEGVTRSLGFSQLDGVLPLVGDGPSRDSLPLV
jgi:anti-anti-sigma factor